MAGRAHDVKLTGRRKEINDGMARNRSSNYRYEYRCGNCGYIGWSRHVDLEMQFNREVNDGTLREV